MMVRPLIASLKQQNHQNNSIAVKSVRLNFDIEPYWPKTNSQEVPFLASGLLHYITKSMHKNTQ